jgi:hypothetical protein
MPKNLNVRVDDEKLYDEFAWVCKEESRSITTHQIKIMKEVVASYKKKHNIKEISVPKPQSV